MMRGWNFKELLLLQAILLVAVLGIAPVASSYANQKAQEHSGVHYIDWRPATPEEELGWLLKRQQEQEAQDASE